jgi:hypothetical protein
MRTRAALIISVVATLAAATQAHAGEMLAPPPHGRTYHAAFPGFGGPEDRVDAKRIHSFEREAGRPIAWAYFSNNWFHRTIRFPAKNARRIARTGSIPFVRLMARSNWHSAQDPNYTLASIASGDWDVAPHGGIRPWCDGAAAYGKPLLAEFGTEVNNGYFPWSGRFNGAGKDADHDGQADGSERFVAAYRHIVDICRAEGADNITWFFHVDVGTWPQKPWNRIAAYYPGNAYVDWIGFSDYGPTKPGQRWVGFRKRLDRVYPQLTALGPKPIAALEFGATEDPAHPSAKARWITHAIGDVATGRWRRLDAISYWHESWRNGDGSISRLRIDSSKRAERAYRRAVAGRRFDSHARFETR